MYDIDVANYFFVGGEREERGIIIIIIIIIIIKFSWVYCTYSSHVTEHRLTK
jgi:hypothetical protein